MASTITQDGIKLIINRSYIDTSGITKPDVFKVGQNQEIPTITDTDLTQAIPIFNGTVNDGGDNTLTGSSGGDNSTDNTTTFKQGAGTTDNTSQNLIANGTNTLKIWTIADLSSLGTNISLTEPFGLWFFVLDQTTLDKFTSGTALEIKLGSDSSNYFSLTKESSDLSIGFNWITSEINVEDLTETGTVTGNIDTFIIEVITNNASDTFIAGDVIYDLLRQWSESDLTKAINSSFPIIDNTAQTVQMRSDLNSVEANGFLLSGFGIFNQDSPALLEGLDSYTEESKGDTDEFIFNIKNKFQISQAI